MYNFLSFVVFLSPCFYLLLDVILLRIHGQGKAGLSKELRALIPQRSLGTPGVRSPILTATNCWHNRLCPVPGRKAALLRLGNR